MRITYLADYPQYIPIIADWLFKEWGYRKPGNKPSDHESFLNTCLNKDQLPITFIVIDSEEKIVGTASLICSGMDTHLELSPWLYALYILPEYRHQGIGTWLVQYAQMIAAQQHINNLYLHTRTSRSLYEQLGWRFLAEENYRGSPTCIMSKTIAEHECDEIPSLKEIYSKSHPISLTIK